MLPRVNILRTDTADYMAFSTDDTVTRALYAMGSWASLMQHISEGFCSDLDAPLVLDVGANLGSYSIPLAKKIAPRNGRVYAFEAQRIVYYQLCGNAFLNRLGNYYAFNIAVGDTDGDVAIPEIDYSTSQNIGAFSLDSELRSALKAVVEKPDDLFSLPLRRLDSITLPSAPTLIKIDVEGLEINVLKGATQLLEHSGFPPILLEAWKGDWFRERRQNLVDYVRYLGYEVFEIDEELIAQHQSYPRQFAFVLDPTAGNLSMIKTR